MQIVRASIEDASMIAAVVSQSNKDVAEQFGINSENNPKHPSFYTNKWVTSDMNRGEEYFLLTESNTQIGCVAFEHPRLDTAYLNRLSVLPKYRHQGAGELLVRHIFQHAKANNVERVSIGIIANHNVLKAWYIRLGFTEKSTKKFDHLPFDVTFMNYDLQNG